MNIYFLWLPIAAGNALTTSSGFCGLASISADLAFVNLRPTVDGLLEREQPRPNAAFIPEHIANEEVGVCVEGGGGVVDHCPADTALFFTAMQVPNPVGAPMMDTSAPFYSKLTAEQRHAVRVGSSGRGSIVVSTLLSLTFFCPPFIAQCIHKHMRVACASACMILAPLLPLPTSTDNDLMYVEKVVNMTERLPPVLLVHAKKDVLYTDL